MNTEISEEKGCGGLAELGARGVPRDEAELSERIKAYFQWCEVSGNLPGIEALSLALGISRITFWRWCNGKTEQSPEWRRICENAKQYIVTALETAAARGEINPVYAIFLLKNYGYSDREDFETKAGQDTDERRTLTAADLPRLAASIGFNLDGDE